VLEPKKGLYDRYVLQLDFNSLYPSIIQEFNICFTTLELGHGSKGVTIGEEEFKTPSKSSIGSDLAGANTMYDLLPDRSVGEGVLPRVLRTLVSQRRQVKSQLKSEKNPVLRSQLDIRQTAIKLTANSLYGCLGFEGSRFYAQTLAALVTSQGRDTLQKTVDLARDSFNAQVIYGDTDSLFVYTGLDDIKRVRALGTELKKAVNEKYRTLEIEIDAIYPKMLLLKKKKYAALKVVNPMRPDIVEREVKGLDLVRHDWCDLSHDASEHFLTQIFNGDTSNVDEAVANVLSYLAELANQVRNDEIALGKYVITKSLTKEPSQYPDGKNLPHVQVAIRLKASGRRISAGEYIKYVICKDKKATASCVNDSPSSGGGCSGISARAYHPDEVLNSNGELVIDVEYYLENQVLPPVMRLCDPIESVEGSRLASALGLDSMKYSRREAAAELETGLLDSDMFRDVSPFTVTCPWCSTCSEFKGVVFAGKAVKTNGLECSSCNRRLPTTAIGNSITLAVRSWVMQYYSTPYQLTDDGTRARQTRNLTLGGNAALVARQFSEPWLYTQLRYLRHMMDVDALWARVESGSGGRYGGLAVLGSLSKSAKSDIAGRNPLSLHDIAVYDELLGRANQALDANSYRLVDLSVFLAPLGLA
jgi:DNA polymerase alpha subunit A